MSDWWITLPATLLIIALSAFFVVIEFSLLAARRHRLEDQAADSRSARAALRGLNQLTVMLAGAQLGITACTFALGAVTKPAVHHLLIPAFGFLPGWSSNAVSFGVARLRVTFLPLVVGEMAPKSWAIAHPERSAKVVAIPARVFVAVLGPLLRWVNAMANRLVAATGVEPVDRAAAAGYDSETIRSLVAHSTEAGVLDSSSGEQIASILGLQATVVEELAAARVQKSTAVAREATAREVQDAARRSGHLRVLLAPHRSGEPLVVHVRDTLRAAADTPAVELARPALVVPTGTSVYDAFQLMRSAGEQFAVVRAGGQYVGVVTWKDILKLVWPGVTTSD